MASRRRVVLAGAAAVAEGLAACATPGTTPAPSIEPRDRPRLPELPADLRPPPSPREFRAAWVATVANIDWPSQPGLPTAVWRAEAIAVLDRARMIGLNAIVLQVRPAADALYASALEPWSEVLTGAQGRAPLPPEDPLALWITEAHRRGLELHAWINPYRARHSTARSQPAANHVANTHAHAVRRYGDQLWLDPAEPDAASHTLAVVADLLRRYDIDGLQIDDYFYPYPVKAAAAGGADLPFPDEFPWSRYVAAGGRLDRAGWRRAQVDTLVQAMHRTVRQTRPQVRFGISPFGLGKPALRPAGISGFSQYDKLYADVERWLDEGWLDYLAPQLYWPIGRAGQDFELLLDYWLARNTRGRHVWPGLYTSMVGAAGGAATNGPPWPAAEVLQQIERIRLRAARGAGGHLHYSVGALMRDRDGLSTRLRTGPYAQAALTPATPWLAGTSEGPARPRLQRAPGGEMRIEAGGGAPAFVWSIWRHQRGGWRFEVHPAAAPVAMDGGDELRVVRAVDSLGRESDAAVWPPPAPRRG